MRRIAATLFVVGVLLGLPVVRAGSVSSVTPPREWTVTIPVEDYIAYSVDIGSTWSLVVGVNVLSGGGAIDVYVTDQANYDKYADPYSTGFSYLVSYTQKITTAYNKTITESGLKVIILDNDNRTVGGATSTGDVRVKVFMGQSSTSFLIGIVVLLVVVLAIVALIVLRVRRKRKAAAMAPPMAPPMEPPPQSPPPPPT